MKITFGIPFLLSVSIFFSLFNSAVAKEIKVTSWNIEWLTTTPDPRFPASARTEKDFEKLARYFQKINPDVLAFQEVDSITAIQKVIGNDYQIFMSTRSQPSHRNQQFNGINQYTGFAVHKSWQVSNLSDLPLLANSRSKLRFATQIQLHRDNQQRIQLLSVHLKAGCSGRYNSSHASCKTLKQQGQVIGNWLRDKEQAQESYILLGDFNHNLAFSSKNQRSRDWLWQDMTDKVNKMPELVTQKTQANCKVRSNRDPNKTHKFRSLIDHIIVSPDLTATATTQNVYEGDDMLRYQLSDHCPVSSTVK
ncbi:endonuclease/exonuclease/phosphatase family protein [Vibrio sp. 10N.286.49.B3]|uniref:endonuclease/exonuclease/phosphatase family protein n=1 Tax=Vibrio sp. 10N.286.49.B3 TaxID=1880855 RepID=UPI001F5309A2|nr:endonuclease/exonuclease/phosphatase family protein [Vibrio sp. 10N.286.49.B3]